MQITILQPTLKAALAHVNNMAPQKPTDPQYAAVTITTHPDQNLVTFTTGNPTAGTSTSLTQTNIGEHGECSVNIRLLNTLIRSLPPTDVSLTTRGTRLHIQAHATRLTIPIMNVPAHQPPHTNDQAHWTQINPTDWNTAVNRAKPIADQADPSRPILQTIHLNAAQSTLTVEATDRYRLTQTTLTSPDTLGDWDATISSQGIPTPDTDRMRLTRTDNTLIIQTPETLDALILTAGQYPDMRRITQMSVAGETTVNRMELIRSVERLQIVNPDPHMSLELRPTPDSLNLAMGADSDEGQGEDRLDAETHGQPITLRINPRYLTDAAKAYTGEHLHVEWADNPYKPIRITDPDHEDQGFIMIVPKRA